MGDRDPEDRTNHRTEQEEGAGPPSTPDPLPPPSDAEFAGAADVIEEARGAIELPDAAPEPSDDAAEPGFPRLLAVSLAVALAMAVAGVGLAWLLRGEWLLHALPGEGGRLLDLGWGVVGATVSLGAMVLLTELWPRFAANLEGTGLQAAEGVFASLGPWRMAAMVAVAAAGEEVLFRGGLQPSVGIGMAGILFGLAHGGWRLRTYWGYVLAAAMAGWIFGWTYRLTGSLWAPLLAHVLHNVAVTAYVARRLRPDGRPASPPEPPDEPPDEPQAELPPAPPSDN